MARLDDTAGEKVEMTDANNSRPYGTVNNTWTTGRNWIAGGLAALLLATPSYAHKTFLAVERYVWDAGEVIEVSLTSALEFPNIEYGPAQDRISSISVFVGDQEISDIAFEEGEVALTATFTPTNNGPVVIAMSTHPRAGEISPEGAAAYFDEIDAEQSTRQAFDDLPGSPALSRSYSKHTKTFLCVASCAGPGARNTAIGQALEFVGVAGENRSFALLRDGDVLPGQRVAIYSVDGSHVETVTDDQGVIILENSVSGVVLLSAIWITLPAQADGVYHSDQATLTVSVQPAE